MHKLIVVREGSSSGAQQLYEFRFKSEADIEAALRGLLDYSEMTISSIGMTVLKKRQKENK